MKTLKTLVTVTVLLSLVAGSVLAGGDKNRGSMGKGNVNQHQVRNK
jgi:hypothetical protein